MLHAVSRAIIGWGGGVRGFGNPPASTLLRSGKRLEEPCNLRTGAVSEMDWRISRKQSKTTPPNSFATNAKPSFLLPLSLDHSLLEQTTIVREYTLN